MRGMPFRKTRVGRRLVRLAAKGHRLARWVYWRSHRRSTERPAVLMVVGCQRSGTGAFVRCFESDLRATVYYEESPLTEVGARRLRVRPLDEMNRIIASHATPLVVFKPLVESQRAVELLDGIPGSRAVWLYRNYRDVADSDVRHFESQFANLRGATDGTGDWRGERVPDGVRAELRRLAGRDLSRHDAAALFWYARNSLFFEQGIDHDPRVLLCKYEEFVTAPEAVMGRVYDLLGLPRPARSTVRKVDRASLRLGASVTLDPDVDSLCFGLQRRLDDARPPLAGTAVMSTVGAAVKESTP